MKAVALNLMRFFEDESCGQCTPCRVGTEKAVKLMGASHWNAELLADLSQVMADASICGLGQAAPNPVKCVFKYFPDELKRAISRIGASMHPGLLPVKLGARPHGRSGRVRAASSPIQLGRRPRIPDGRPRAPWEDQR